VNHHEVWRRHTIEVRRIASHDRRGDIALERKHFVPGRGLIGR